VDFADSEARVKTEKSAGRVAGGEGECGVDAAGLLARETEFGGRANEMKINSLASQRAGRLARRGTRALIRPPMKLVRGTITPGR